MKARYTLPSRLSVDEALERLASLFTREHVAFRREGHSITSTKIPIPVLSVDRRFYTRNNWVGVNPFLLVSGVEASCRVSSEGTTVVDIVVNRKRTAIICGLAILLVLMVSSALPDRVATVFLVSFALALVLASQFLAGPLMRREIQHELNR